MSSLALTFDDGPDPATTPRLLDLLAAQQAHATFFPIAPRAARHPHLIRRMLREGHGVGVHCWTHERHSSHDDGWGRRDVATSLDVLRRLGAEPRWWRTPWGDRADWTARVAHEHGLRLLDWNVDSHDWRGDFAETMFDATRDRLEAGAVVLAHDGIGPGARRADGRETIGYVARVLAHATDRRLALRAL